jgi:hypothetical protein
VQRAVTLIADGELADSTGRCATPSRREPACGAAPTTSARRGMQRARRIVMMKTVKHTFSTIGDRSGDIARTFGTETAGLARRFGGGTASLAKRIGPRRALIGLAIAAVAIGGSVMLVRYLRARKVERERRTEGAGEDASASHDAKSGNRSRGQRADDVQPSHG